MEICTPWCFQPLSNLKVLDVAMPKLRHRSRSAQAMVTVLLGTILACAMCSRAVGSRASLCWKLERVSTNPVKSACCFALIQVTTYFRKHQSHNYVIPRNVGAAHNNIATYSNYTVAHHGISVLEWVLCFLLNRSITKLSTQFKKADPGHDQFPILNKYGTSYQVSL